MLRAVAEARAAQRRMRSLAKLNLELAKREAQQKVTAIGVAGGLAVAAFVIVLYAIGLIFGLVAIVLDLWLPLWASVLIVIGLMLLAAAILAWYEGGGLGAQGVASASLAGDRRGRAHDRDREKPCLNALSRTSARKSPPSDSASTTISQHSKVSALSGVPFVAGGLVAAAVVIFATARRRKRKKPKPTAITLSWKLR